MCDQWTDNQETMTKVDGEQLVKCQLKVMFVHLGHFSD
jgi:hypothetical protein